MQYIQKYISPLGPMTFASDGHALIGVWFDHQKYFADTLEGENTERDLPVFRETQEWLDRYFRGENPGALPPVSLKGSPFRLAVWDVLRSVPYGSVITYGDIAAQVARQLGKERMSAQAVGGAVGKNPISVLIPCHRVVGSDGSLTGYAGGIEKKEKLLLLEGAIAPVSQH